MMNNPWYVYFGLTCVKHTYKYYRIYKNIGRPSWGENTRYTQDTHNTKPQLKFSKSTIQHGTFCNTYTVLYIRNMSCYVTFLPFKFSQPWKNWPKHFPVGTTIGLLDCQLIDRNVSSIKGNAGWWQISPGSHQSSKGLV